MNCREKSSNKGRVLPHGGSFWLSLVALLVCGLPALAQPQDSALWGAADTAGTLAAARRQDASQQVAGTISGTVVDRTGAVVAGARVQLSREDQSVSQEVESDADGQFSFGSVVPGTFQLTIALNGFATQTFSGTVHSGENYVAPPIELVVAGATTEVQVTMSRAELAEAEIKDEEKQRVLGVIPNFYVTYNPAALSLTPKQKFELAWRATVDPVNFGLVGATAGIQQATNAWSGYGQGAQGFGKRYGASYADLVTNTFIGSAILPSILKQDPRYFYKGTGSKRSRILYALASSVICKGDNGRWQANYSSIVGGLASGGISNLYYPSTDRGAELTVENALIGIGTSAAANVLQEFLIRKLTRHAPNYAPATPSAP
jgi:Carboxypeptidase regulatory-like domain